MQLITVAVHRNPLFLVLRYLPGALRKKCFVISNKIPYGTLDFQGLTESQMLSMGSCTPEPLVMFICVLAASK
jgi:hypothetical protein